MKLFTIGRPVAVCFALAACVTSGTTEFVSYEAVGVPRLFAYAASSGNFATVVYGNPSRASKPKFDAAVVEAMGDYVWGRKSNFTLTAPEAAGTGYRVVMVFSGARHFGGKAACRAIDPAAVVPVTGAVGLQAAFCHGDKVLSQAHMRFERAGDDAGSDGLAAFELALAQAVISIFPLRDHSREAPDVVIPPP
jgi:hypothetical protein